MSIRPEVTGWIEDVADLPGDNNGSKSHKSNVDHCPLGLDHSITEMKFGLNTLHEGQEKGFQEMKEAVVKLSDVLLDKDNGLYSRVKTIENSRAAFVKWIWIVCTALTGTAAVGLIKLLF